MSAAPVPLERAILAACLRLLKLAGIPAWRANTGAVRLASRSGRARFVRFGPRGQSDILGVLPPTGRLYFSPARRSGRARTPRRSSRRFSTP